MKPLSNPILFVCDNPAMHGGLSRIGRDLATLACTMPELRVGYLGRGIRQSRKLPFITYDYPEGADWGASYLPDAWRDFAGNEQGVIITLDDISRRAWMVHPQGMPKHVVDFVSGGEDYALWGYFPIDALGPNLRTLPVEERAAIAKYDRVLTASEWACDVLKSGGLAEADWLPHGIFTETFRPDAFPKEKLSWDADKVYVGCVMANQSRKDFGVLFDCIAHLKAHYGNRLRVWIHTDELIRYWNIYALATDFGVADCLEITQECNDYTLALRYSACDCTLLPSAGEGFGYPIAESMCCGTACVVTDYAAGKDLVDEDCRVRPISLRVDTPYNLMRAVLPGQMFANKVMGMVDQKRRDPEYWSAYYRNKVIHLDWESLKHSWMRWFREGLNLG